MGERQRQPIRMRNLNYDNINPNEQTEREHSKRD